MSKASRNWKRMLKDTNKTIAREGLHFAKAPRKQMTLKSYRQFKREMTRP